MSVYSDCLNAVLQTANGLGLTTPGNGTLTFVIGKVSKSQDGLDSLPQGFVVPYRDPESVTPFGSENEVNVIYKIEAAIRSGNAGDLSGAQLPGELDWREQLRLALQQTIPAGCATVWRMQCRPGVVIDERELTNDYDVSGLTFFLHSIEPSKTGA